MPVFLFTYRDFKRCYICYTCYTIFFRFYFFYFSGRGITYVTVNETDPLFDLCSQLAVQLYFQKRPCFGSVCRSRHKHLITRLTSEELCIGATVAVKFRVSTHLPAIFWVRRSALGVRLGSMGCLTSQQALHFLQQSGCVC